MKCSCPNCHRSLPLDQALPAQIHCPHCNATFLMDAATIASAARAAPTMAMRPVAQAAPKTDTVRHVAQAAAQTGTMRPVAQAAAPTPPPVRRSQAGAAPAAVTRTPRPPWVLGVLFGGLGLFLIAGIAIAIYCFTGTGSPPQGTNENAAVKPPAHLPVNTGAEKRGDPPPKDINTRVQPNDQPMKEVVLAVVSVAQEIKPLPAEEVKYKKPEGPAKLVVKVIETVTKTEKVKPRKLRLAVSAPRFDDMGKLLESLGNGYQFTEFTEKELENLDRLQQYDVVFLTCQSSSPKKSRLTDALRQFVKDGGTLYASDLRFDALRGAFPEFIEIKGNRDGDKQTLKEVDVVDPGLREVLGDKIQLHFDQAGWKPATFKRELVKVLMEGNFRAYPQFGQKENQHFEEPLLVKFSCGKGTVIFTSFHNSKQKSEVEEKLLRYLVFTAVTSIEETKVATTMISGGFSPQPTRRLSASDEAPSATQTYNNKKAGRLQFALGFSNAGAKLRLELVSPSGEKVVREGTATFVVEVDNAAAGDWRYTVTALHIPYPNFPFTLAVGEAAAK